MTLQRPRR